MGGVKGVREKRRIKKHTQSSVLNTARTLGVFPENGNLAS